MLNAAGLSVASGKVVSSNDNDVTITVFDIDLRGGLSTGTGKLQVHGLNTGHTIGLGDANSQLDLDADELQRITVAGGMRLGGSEGGSISVSGVTADSTAQIMPMMSLMALQDDAQIAFTSAASTFYGLGVQADGGVTFDVNVLANEGNVYLDGDVENDPLTDDDPNGVRINADNTISAKLLLTLESSTGAILPYGTVSLEAGAGIVLQDDVVLMQEDGTSVEYKLVYNADSDGSGSGTLTVAVDKTIQSNHAHVLVTAWDLDLAGGLNSLSGTTNVLGSVQHQTTGLGGTAQDLQLTGDELQRLSSAGGLRLGSCDVGTASCSQGGVLLVNGITADHSQYVTGIVTLISSANDQHVAFDGAPSTFHGLAVQACDGVMLSTDLTAQTDDLTIDGDLDSTVSDGDVNSLHFTDGRTVTAEGLLTLQAASGVLLRAGSLTLSAGNGIHIGTHLNSSAVGRPLVLNSDMDSSGSAGLLEIATDQIINSNNGAVTLTAFDFELQGSLNAGTSTVSVHPSVITAGFGQTVGFGQTAKDLHVSDTELSRITAQGGLGVGNTGSGSITVDGVLQPDGSASTVPTITLLAGLDKSTILFTNRGSTFNDLVAQADNGVVFEVDVTTSNGDITLDGDLEQAHSMDAYNSVFVEDARTITADGYIYIHSTTFGGSDGALGGLAMNGDVTLRAGAGIDIMETTNNAQNAKTMILHADYDGDSVGTITVADTKTIVTNQGPLLITTWDIDLVGAINTGGPGFTLHGATIAQTIGIGDASGSPDMHLSDAELASISAVGGMVVGSTSSGNLILAGVQVHPVHAGMHLRCQQHPKPA